MIKVDPEMIIDSEYEGIRIPRVFGVTAARWVRGWTEIRSHRA
jgi:hypothetical protein